MSHEDPILEEVAISQAIANHQPQQASVSRSALREESSASVDELHRRADQLSHYLRELGMEQDDLMAMAVDPSLKEERSKIEHYLGYFRKLLEGLVTDESQPSDEGPRLSEAERHRVLYEWNDTKKEYPTHRCVHEMFEDQVRNTPNAVALECGESTLSYQELNTRANQLAHHLRGLGVDLDARVAVCVDRSPEMVVALLAVLKAGGAYLPLDPTYPRERLEYVIRDSSPAVLLTQSHLRSLFAGIAEDVAPILELSAAAAWQEPETNPDKEKLGLTANHLAYVIYTSGSTGQPKGVAVEHISLVNLICWHRDTFALHPGKSQSSVAGFGFDAATWEIWPPLCTGGSLILPQPASTSDPEALFAWWVNQKLDVSFLPTAMAEFAFTRGITNPHLQTLLVGGDHLRRLPSHAPSFSLCNNYGPTETTVVATSGPIELSDKVLSIGRPIANARVYILDADLQPLPAGVAGELYIGGRGVARGYLNRPALTAERFLKDPFSQDDGARMYKTGDLGRWLNDGTIEFLGRNDFQVKIRGFRIELGEIEAHLVQYPGVLEAVVLAREDTIGDKRLVAYYTTAEQQAGGRGLAEVNAGEPGFPGQLRTHLAHKLPEYMVPAAYVHLEKLPLTANGKLDRKSLPAPKTGAYAAPRYEAPQGNIESALSALWAEVLKLESIGRHDDFFALGGHSLSATQLVSGIRARLHVDLPLKSVFEHPTVGQLAEVIIQAGVGTVDTIEPVDRARFDRLPLSYVQERLWFIHQLEPNSPAYNLPLSVTINGDLDSRTLERALNLLIARHEDLRTVFPSSAGQPYQHILNRLDIHLECVDLTNYQHPGKRYHQANHLSRTDAAVPFDLVHGPLLRARLLKLNDQEHILLLNMHHIISDGWSQGILIRELGLILDAFRDGRLPQLDPLPIQYADYSVWQRERLEGGGLLNQQLVYWHKKLAGVPELLNLPLDYPRPGRQDFAGATQPLVLDAQLTGKLKSLGKQHGGTLFMVLLAAFKVLLHRYTGQQDICVGTPIANRQQQETHGLIGMFVNTLALRSELRGDLTFAQLLSQVRVTCLESYEHQDTPFEKVVELLRPQRNAAYNPIFQVMVILQNADTGAGDSRLPLYPSENTISQFDLTLEFKEIADGLAGSIQYSTSLYLPATMKRLAGHFIALCEAIADAPAARICDLEYIGETEKHCLLKTFNNTSAGYPREKCIHQLFAEQALANPGKEAVIFGDDTLTYEELDSKAGDLALYLQFLGVRPDTVVALCLERSLEMMVALLGTEQAGGAYLPLDPSYPEDRLAYMLQDSKATVVLTQARFRDRLRSVVSKNTKVVALDEQWFEIGKTVAHLRAQGTSLRLDVKPHNLSYVIYTSGSTGKPKGVLIEHRALVNRIHWMQKSYPLSDRDVVLQKTPYSFDVSVWEFFWPLMASASLVFAVPDGHKDVRYLANIINTRQVTTLHFVPSMLGAFLDHTSGQCGSVRRIFSSGEALDRKSVDRYRETFPNAALYNLYGPTEAAIDVTAYDCSQIKHPFVPIGSPIDNTQIYILDQQLHPQPIGIPGELHIQGEGLARGYLNHPQLTQEKFVPSPFLPGARMYKTGDLARWLDDGNIEYLGRSDQQVKLRGFRIELGEIETSLREHTLVRQAVVVAREDEPGEKRLVAYVVLASEREEGNATQWTAVLQAHLAAHLPEYMVPAAFVQLQALPVTSNGKLDRKALPAAQQGSQSAAAYEAPSGGLEAALANIWAEVLKIEKVGRHDNFFALGGHSLLTLQLVNKLEREGIQISPVDIFKHGSIESLAAKVEFQGKHNPTDRAICIRDGGSAPPLFITHDGSGQLIYVPTLAPYIDPDIPIYGLPAKPACEPHLKTIEQMAMRMVRMIRAVQPEGPYHVAGWSLGGIPAYEVAVQLAAAGQKLGFVGLMDTTYLEGGKNLVDMHHDEFDEKRELLRAIHEIVRYYPSVTVEERSQAIEVTTSLAATTDFDGFVEKCREMTLLPSRWSDLTSEQLRQTFARIHSYESASVHYSAPEIAGPVHLFRAQESDLDLPLRGWDAALTENNLHLVPVPGTHLSMMTKPNIVALGQAISAAIRNAAARTDQSTLPLLPLQAR